MALTIATLRARRSASLPPTLTGGAVRDLLVRTYPSVPVGWNRKREPSQRQIPRGRSN